MREDRITTYEFVDALLSSLGVDNDNDAMSVARGLKLTDDFDEVHRNEYIKRSAAARIIHNALLCFLHEEDLSDWSAAEELMDLYDCHTCVNNIAQVYAKGIMDTEFKGIFRVNGNVSKEESTIYLLRMMNCGLRKCPAKGKTRIFKVINKEEAAAKLHSDSHAKLIDVRFPEDYEKGHLPDSINIALTDINKNPYIVGENRDNCVMLYCNKGYQSRLAASLLLNVGYKNVYVVNVS